MSSQFFERQETQRQATRWLVLGFIAAILLVVVAINLVGILAIGESPLRIVRDEPHVVIWVSAFIAGVILVATWHKSSQLRAGGAAVARSLGGVGIGTGETDFARKRLLNIVEEMAIAARVRKPMVFVLPEEQGINAFAAGHSPDEAAVAVTQGALDKLDRDQLQAIIGHEFSHILNGDMKINMRLAAWIFGLFVLTDLALRLLRVRSRGKGAAQLKMFAIGVFVAGSIGMIAGRLLQAAVSRRREHLADASAVQFTRNPAALQSAFIIMAASQEGSRLEHPASADVAHMFFANSAPSWADKVGGSWFATHPPIEERVHALDNRVTPIRFRTLVSDERRKMAARQSAAAAETAPPAKAAAATSNDVVTPDTPAMPQAAAIALAVEAAPANTAAAPMTLAETMPPGIQPPAGRASPPDLLRERLSAEQQAAIPRFVAQVEGSTHAVQGAFVASMLATEPAKWRPQLTKLASVLGIELLRESQAQVARVAHLPPAARLPALIDLFGQLETMDPAHRKRLRALARAFAPTVGAGDMLRYVVTRVLERKLAKATEESPPVPLPERAEAVCTLYAALAQCRFGAGKAGQNSYRAGLIGMVPPQKWAPYPEALVTPAQLDAAMAAARQIHPSGKKSFSEGLARVVAVGGRLTVPQGDLLRGLCILVDCAMPLLPADVVYEENELAPAVQASAR